MPFYKNKCIGKLIHPGSFSHYFDDLSTIIPELGEIAEMESGSISLFFLPAQY
jgi:hypothetical protein